MLESNPVTHGFRQIPGYPRYAINESGAIMSVCIRNTKTNRPWSEARHLKPRADKDGYHYVSLSRDGQKRNMFVHKLVLTTFVGPRPNGMECRHLDGIQTNNHVSNLAWSTHSENLQDKLRHGTDNRGEKCYIAKLTDKDVMEIRARAAGGETQSAIAKDFAVLQPQVCRIILRKNWKHV